MPLLAEHFQVFAVDLRGQGRSTWTPGRYTVDVMGGDLVRFIDLVVARPTAVYEDPPPFASEAIASCGQPVGQGIGPSFRVGPVAGPEDALVLELALTHQDLPPPGRASELRYGRKAGTGSHVRPCD